MSGKTPLFAIILAFAFQSTGFAQSQDEVISKWLKTNEGVSRLKLDFAQRQSMKTVKAPMVQRGTLYLDLSRKRFRWETGSTLVIGSGSNITIQRTRKREYEQRASAAGAAPGLSALAKGFPSSMSSFKRQYKVLEVSKEPGKYSILTQPLGASARGVKTFTFKVDSKSYNLEGISIVLKDGSRISTSFSNVQRNPSIPASMFTPNLEGYTETKFGQ